MPNKKKRTWTMRPRLKETVPLSLRLPPNLHERLVNAAWCRGVSLNQLILDALDAGVPVNATRKPGRPKLTRPVLQFRVHPELYDDLRKSAAEAAITMSEEAQRRCQSAASGTSEIIKKLATIEALLQEQQ